MELCLSFEFRGVEQFCWPHLRDGERWGGAFPITSSLPKYLLWFLAVEGL